MAKKKEEVKEQPKHVLTLDEYDTLVMDAQCLGAQHERDAILDELIRRRVHLLDIARAAGESELKVEANATAEGLYIAVNFINSLPAYESRCGCRECGVV